MNYMYRKWILFLSSIFIFLLLFLGVINFPNRKVAAQWCLVNGGWTGWSACSTSCGPGVLTRTCTNPAPACGGADCVGSPTQACMINDPDVWTTCTLKCGGGTQTNECGTPRACNTQDCDPWIKTKNTSFISINPLTNLIALLPVPYDADDTTDQYFVVDKDGVVAAPAISLDVSNFSLTAKTGNPEYKVIYTPNTYSMTPSNFLSYVKARKKLETLTSVDEIEANDYDKQVLVLTGPITIDDTNKDIFDNRNLVLIINGDLNFNPTTFNPTSGYIAFLTTGTITFANSTTEARGIFVAPNIDLGTTADQGIKIIGNLAALTGLTNNRKWAATSKPSVFIVFDQSYYINLFPYLSTASYQWKQIQ